MSLLIRCIWGRTYPTEGLGLKTRTITDKSKIPSTLPNDQGTCQTTTEIRDKEAWIQFNKNLMSTMNSDLKNLWKIPNYDPIET